MVDLDPFDDVSLELLRFRRSAKWTKYPPDVLPAWVAETDFALALPVREALLAAFSRDDTGYADSGRPSAARSPSFARAPASAGTSTRRGFGWPQT